MIVTFAVELGGELQREGLPRCDGLSADYVLVAGRVAEDHQHAIRTEIAHTAGRKLFAVSAQPSRQIDRDTSMRAPLRPSVRPGGLNGGQLGAFIRIDVEGFR
jgi:hypothetical protein